MEGDRLNDRVDDETKKIERPKGGGSPASKSGGSRTPNQPERPVRKEASAQPRVDEVEALERQAKADEEQKRRVAVRKKQETAPTPERQTVQTTKKQPAHRVGKKEPFAKMAKSAKETAEGGDFTTMITVVISVVALLLILWFMATTIMSSVGRKGGVAVDGGTESSAVATAEATSAVATEATTEAATSSEGLPAPLTEGDAEYRNPDSWVGKTFSVKERVNVRSEAGTTNSIVGVGVPGDTVAVKEAVSVDDATWVRGTVTQSDGTTFSGWVYAYGLNKTAQ